MSVISTSNQFDFREKFEFLPKTLDLMGTAARNKLSWGGIRSGKTQGALMYGVFAYAMRFRKCDILVLRRHWKELESGAMKDFNELVPVEMMDAKASKGHPIVTLSNGSRVVFGHCASNKDKDIDQYLGSAYPFILVDECGQFSPAAWERLVSRNTVNVGCEAADDGSMPIPCIWGCTNPLGSFWPYYRSVFVDKEPFDIPEGAKKDENGFWWVEEAGEWTCVYNPTDYASVHSTPLDNPYILLRDPGLIARLKTMSKAQRDKMLYGLAGKVEGQYFECFDESSSTVSLREDPTAIIWQPWQPVWLGWDWGVGHWNTVYFFTKAFVKCSEGPKASCIDGEYYREKTVCFREILDRGKTDEQMANMVAAACKRPCDPKRCPDCQRAEMAVCTHPTVRPTAIYFSHEKFNRVLEANSPAEQFSKLLVKRGLCALTPASKDRIGGAACITQGFLKGDLVILDTCKEIIKAIPSLETDPQDLNDVYKPQGLSKTDDCYDGFRYGVFGMLRPRRKPENVRLIEETNSITDPFMKKLHMYKQVRDKEAKEKKRTQEYQQKSAPWANRLPK